MFGLAWGALLCLESGSAEIIDRMVAVVDGRVVTSGDIDRYRRLAVLFGDPVTDDEAGMLQRVIEDLLIQTELDKFRGIRVREELIDSYIAQLEGTESVDPGVLREAVGKRLERMNYFDLRFRRFTVVTDAEIVAYYETAFLPAAEARGLEPMPPLDAVRDLIEDNVITEKADRQIATWTDSLARRSEVEIVEYRN